MVSSNLQTANNSPSSVASLRGEHRGKFSQHTQFAEVGLQTGEHRVLESFPKTACLPLDVFASRGSHQVARYMTWHQDSRAVSLCSGLSMGSINLVDLGFTSQEDLINKSQNLKEEQEQTPVNSSEWLPCLTPVDPTETGSGPQVGIYLWSFPLYPLLGMTQSIH